MLMLLGTAAFAIGVSVEKNQGPAETVTEATHTDEAPEGEGVEGAESPPEQSETTGGINLESTPVIALGVILSLAAAGAVMRWPRRGVFAAAAVFCILFSVFDGREVLHQLDENAGGIATLAALALVLHLGAATVASLALVPSREV